MQDCRNREPGPATSRRLGRARPARPKKHPERTREERDGPRGSYVNANLVIRRLDRLDEMLDECWEQWPPQGPTVPSCSTTKWLMPWTATRRWG